MATKWIDFNELKRRVSIRDVLERYGYLDGLSEKKPGKLIGPCPIHGGKGKASFNVDVGKNIFNCFSQCGGGNILDLVMKIEGCEIRQAGEKLAEWFGLSFERNTQASEGHKSAKVRQESKPVAVAAQSEHRINPPLERPLQTLNADHAYLVDRGLNVPTIQAFGVGHCTRGLMRSRIAIPIHNEAGELVAYAGRAVDEQLAREKGKYRLPDNFKKSHVLYNLNRAKEHADQGLIVVEGFFGAMKVAQAIGLERANVVALMGCTLSDQQELLLLAQTDRLALMLDGDDAGNKCLREFYQKLRRKIYLKDVHLEDGEQPDDLSEDRIRELLS